LRSYHCLYSVFFFSSRRRHTRSKRDWSSDVCSSDLCVSRLSPGSGRRNVWLRLPSGSNASPSWSGRAEGRIRACSSSDGFSEYRSEERRVGKECRDRWRGGG